MMQIDAAKVPTSLLSLFLLRRVQETSCPVLLSLYTTRNESSDIGSLGSRQGRELRASNIPEDRATVHE
jgi:hypothetical protein